MSLRALHIFFVSAATLLAFGFGVWARDEYSFLAGLSLVVGISLIGYLTWFIRKIANK